MTIFSLLDVALGRYLLLETIHLILYNVYKPFKLTCEDLTWMRDKTLATDAPIAIARTIFFLFQIAILETFRIALLRKGHRA